MRDGARGVAWLVERCDLIATSPYARAVETAELLATALGGPAPVRVDALTPDTDGAAVVAWLRTLPPEATVAVVGHEPQLSSLVGLLLTGRPAPILELKKGAVALVHLPPPVRPGTGLLHWALAPSQLRRLGRKGE